MSRDASGRRCIGRAQGGLSCSGDLAHRGEARSPIWRRIQLSSARLSRSLSSSARRVATSTGPTPGMLCSRAAVVASAPSEAIAPLDQLRELLPLGAQAAKGRRGALAQGRGAFGASERRRAGTSARADMLAYTRNKHKEVRCGQFLLGNP